MPQNDNSNYFGFMQKSNEMILNNSMDRYQNH